MEFFQYPIAEAYSRVAPMEITLTEYIQKLSIQLCLSEWKHEINKGDLIVFAAFGEGFTWGERW